jgi:late competence protein required for DNA uptake (superfamily II DNA/RNA helicase)
MQKSIEKGNYLMKKNLNERKKGKMLCDKCGQEKESLVLLLFDGIIIFICEKCSESNKKKI